MKDRLKDPNLHRLLRRQLKKTLTNDSIDLDNFLDLVNGSYQNFDKERQLNQRAEMLSNQELKEINLALQEKNSFLDSFNHGLAHDAKNHTANLKGLLTIFSKYQKLGNQEKLEQIVQKLELSVNQMASLLDGFLYLSSADGFKESDSFEVDAEQLEKSILLEIDYLVNSDLHELGFDLNTHGLFYPRSILKIILVNLISNSLKFSKTDKKGLINISLSHNEEEIFILVSDNGMGMDLNDQSSTMFKLFDRRSTSKGTKGYGIGLYMIKNILDRNQGRIKIDSELRKGTRIEISLPKTERNEV